MREQAGRQQLRWRQRRRRCPMKMCRGRLKVDKDGRRGEDGGGRGDERAGDTLPALCADAASAARARRACGAAAGEVRRDGPRFCQPGGNGEAGCDRSRDATACA